MLLHSCCLLASSFLPWLPPSASDEWPGWRGPAGSGVASGSPPIEWSEEKNVRWKTAIPGKGISSPVIWGERVFLTTSVSTGKKAEPAAGGSDGGERGGREGEGGRDRGAGPGRGGPGWEAPLEEQDFSVLALDRKSGAILWQKKVNTAMPHQGTHPDGSYASPTPATDGEHVFASFGSFGIFALTMSGEVAWQQDLGDLEIQGGFGEGSSPVLYGELLILNWDHEGDSFLVAFDKKTGKERWRTPRPGGTSWCTPIIVKAGEAHEIVVGGVRTIAYDVETGRELWGYGESAERGGPIASPVAMEELVLLTDGGRSGQMRALIALPPGEAGREEGEALLWSERCGVPHIPSPIAYQGKLYFLKQNSGLLSVLDTTSGKLEYGPERLQGVADVYASLVLASGHLYVAGRDGTVEVLSAWPVRTLSVNTLADGIDASPAIAGNELFLRSHHNLYCIAEK